MSETVKKVEGLQFLVIKCNSILTKCKDFLHRLAWLSTGQCFHHDMVGLASGQWVELVTVGCDGSVSGGVGQDILCDTVSGLIQW